MKKNKKIRGPTWICRGWNDNYQVYVLSAREWLLYLAEAVLLTALISWLFYHSVYGMVLLLPFAPIFIRNKKQELKEKRKERLRYEFKECLQSVSGALHAGYSMENAWKDAEGDMLRFLGAEADMSKELLRMNRRIALNMTLEELLHDFAARSGVEDVVSFTEVFSFAKRGGGDLNGIIKNTYLRIADKVELEREIETAMAAKKTEHKIMSLMPILILLYIGMTSPDFLSALYGNLLGVAVMTVCLLGYGFSVLLGKRIVRIEI